MSESNLSVDEQPAPEASSEIPQLETAVAEQSEAAREIALESDEFKPPAGFVFVVPNFTRGATTQFSPQPSVSEPAQATGVRGELADPAQIAAQVQPFHTETALLFSAKDLPPDSNDLSKWMPLHAPYLHGRAKCVLLHIDTWTALQGFSLLLRWHRSPGDSDLSDVHEIYAMPPGGAAVAHAETLSCTACGASPAPIPCVSCHMPYCSQLCRAKHADKHEVECVTEIMRDLSIKIKKVRLQMHENTQAFREQQLRIAERNRGKLITVRRVDAKGNVLSETQEMAPGEAVSTGVSTDADATF